ncbi:CoA-binding protein [Inquilinus sp. NPDC058860]|uniref:CoA-binding protein n=1 Tax=Inquilinus sp. NPDC058860 TaxID=3346652 RepID=UPI0036A1F521
MDHERYDDGYLRGILRGVKTIAMVGASPNWNRPSYFAMTYLQGKGYKVVPVNPGVAGQTILKKTVYARLADVPQPVDMVDIFRNSEAAAGVVDEALALPARPKVIWMQLGVRNDAAAAKAEAAGIQVVMNRCPKIEWARLNGELSWMGTSSRVISSKIQRKG